MKTYFSEPYIDVQYDPDTRTVLAIWKDAATSSEDYRNGLNAALDVAKSEGALNYLTDMRKQRVVSPEDRKWFENVALPKGVGIGMVRGIVVFDGGAFKRYYLNNISRKIKGFPVEMRFFSAIEEGLAWARSQNS